MSKKKETNTAIKEIRNKKADIKKINTKGITKKVFSKANRHTNTEKKKGRRKEEI